MTGGPLRAVEFHVVFGKWRDLPVFVRIVVVAKVVKISAVGAGPFRNRALTIQKLRTGPIRNSIQKLGRLHSETDTHHSETPAIIQKQ